MHDIANAWMWFGFSVFLIIALGLDAYVMHKRQKGKSPSVRAALIWTLIWIGCAVLFTLFLWGYVSLTDSLPAGQQIALTFFTGYLVEKSLSLDNLFVFYMIFQQFSIPLPFQPRIFSIGIWSAIVMRLVLILLGSHLVKNYHWVLYVMGFFLLVIGCKMLFSKQEALGLNKGRLFTWLQKHLRITQKIESQHFFVYRQKLLYVTPLLIALIFIEISDLIFAFDSIPAIFAITTDPFIVWTANIFAILGLRSLYFIMAGMIERFYLLKYGIALILIFIACKMLAGAWVTIPVGFSLLIIAAIMITFTIMSFYFSDKKRRGKKH